MSYEVRCYLSTTGHRHATVFAIKFTTLLEVENDHSGLAWLTDLILVSLNSLLKCDMYTDRS